MMAVVVTACLGDCSSWWVLVLVWDACDLDWTLPRECRLINQYID